MNRRRFLYGSMAALACPYVKPALADDDLVVRYNSAESIDEDKLGAKALKMALGKTKRPYRAVGSDIAYSNQAGTENALRNGSLHVGYFGASRNLATFSDPVMFPIDRGLLGYRTFLINRDKQSEFSSVRTMDDLKNKVALQGLGWGDVDILQNAGIRVRTGLYKNLHLMTVMGRGDFFPRAAYETLNEAVKFRSDLPQLEVEETLCLRYPFALMFFTTKSRPQLHEDLSLALEAAFKDGSYEEMFFKDKSVHLTVTAGNLDKRRRFDVANPFLFEDFAKIESKYWFKV